MITKYITHCEIETIALGAKLAKYLKKGDFIAYWGDLGSGKTHFSKGVCKGLGSVDEVTSPTFTLINEYQAEIPIYHFDFYRIISQDEIFNLGYEEYFYGSGICLIEWADRISNFLPSTRIDVYLKGFYKQQTENEREIKIALIGAKIKDRDWEGFSFENIRD